MKRRSWMIPALLALSLVLTACGGQPPGETVILPLEEMRGGFEGPSVTDDTGTSVVVRFTSGVPTACNVTYGPDAGYGSLATMQQIIKIALVTFFYKHVAYFYRRFLHAHHHALQIGSRNILLFYLPATNFPALWGPAPVVGLRLNCGAG